MHPWRRPGLQLHGVLNGQNPTSFNKNGRRGSHSGNVRGDSSDDFLVADHLRELMPNVYRVRSFSCLIRNLGSSPILLFHAFKNIIPLNSHLTHPYYRQGSCQFDDTYVHIVSQICQSCHFYIVFDLNNFTHLQLARAISMWSASAEWVNNDIRM